MNEKQMIYAWMKANGFAGFTALQGLRAYRYWDRFDCTPEEALYEANVGGGHIHTRRALAVI